MNSVSKLPVETPDRVCEMTEDRRPRLRRSILMLEDNSALAEILRVFLESRSFQVECVGNGADGVRQILRKDYDILLCDMVMPHLPGDMFYLAVERTKPHLCRRFVFMAGHKANPKHAEFIRKVEGTMLWKPFLLSQLLGVIERSLEKNSG